MHQRSRRRLSRATSTGFAVALVAASAGIGTAAQAAPAGPVYSASSSASLIRVIALDATPLGAQRAALADLKVATAGSTVDSKGAPQTSTGAAYVDGSVLGQKLPDVPRSAIRQQAAPDNVHPAVLQNQPIDLALARVGLGQLRAHARWHAGTANPTRPAKLTEAAGAVANLTVIPGAGLPAPVPYIGSSVLDLPHTAYAQSKTDIVKVHGQRGLGVTSHARISAAQLTVFRGSPQQHTIRIISPPTLTATAAGTHRSSVHYTSPIVEIVDARGRTLHRLDAPDQVIEIPLGAAPDLSTAKKPKAAPVAPALPLPGPKLPGVPATPLPEVPVPGGNGLSGLLPDLGLGSGGGGSGASGPYGAGSAGAGSAGAASAGASSAGASSAGAGFAAGGGGGGHGALLRLSIGHVTKSVTATSVSAKAATLRLEVLDTPQTGKLLDVAIGDLRAAAKVPPGGLLPPQPSPSPSAAGKGGADGGKLPVTGSSLTMFLVAGIGLVVMGRLAMVAARRP